MRLQDYEERDGKRVWLSNDELNRFIDDAKTPIQKAAFLFAGRVGLRRSEIVQVTMNDIVEGPTGHHVRIWEDYTKREMYREPPVPDQVVHIAETLAHDIGPGTELVDVSPNTVYRWVKRCAERQWAETNDAGWKYLDVHDLRRTWGTYLLERGVLPAVVMDWGGWEDWETFRTHYLGQFSPEAITRERQKVPYYADGAPIDEDIVSMSLHPAEAPRSKPSWVKDRVTD